MAKISFRRKKGFFSHAVPRVLHFRTISDDKMIDTTQRVPHNHVHIRLLNYAVNVDHDINARFSKTLCSNRKTASKQ